MPTAVPSKRGRGSEIIFCTNLVQLVQISFLAKLCLYLYMYVRRCRLQQLPYSVGHNALHDTTVVKYSLAWIITERQY